MSVFSNIVKNEGPLTLWKGSLFPLLGFGACNSVLFAVNENFKNEFQKTNQRNFNTLWETLLAGGCAGIANTIISSPMEHIRIRM